MWIIAKNKGAVFYETPCITGKWTFVIFKEEFLPYMPNVVFIAKK